MFGAHKSAGLKRERMKGQLGYRAETRERLGPVHGRAARLKGARPVTWLAGRLLTWLDWRLRWVGPAGIGGPSLSLLLLFFVFCH